jgi:hypothetical protein
VGYSHPGSYYWSNFDNGRNADMIGEHLGQQLWETASAVFDDAATIFAVNGAAGSEAGRSVAQGFSTAGDKKEPGYINADPVREDESAVPEGEICCPFCQACASNVTTGALEPVPDSHRQSSAIIGKARFRRKSPAGRKVFRVGNWWASLGYKGPRFCQRCSEVFRDHLLLQKSNSAACNRNSPCDDSCSKILAHFKLPPGGLAEVFTGYDAKRVERTQTGARSSSGKRSVSSAMPSKRPSKKAAVQASAAVSLLLVSLAAWVGTRGPEVPAGPEGTPDSDVLRCSSGEFECRAGTSYSNGFPCEDKGASLGCKRCTGCLDEIQRTCGDGRDDACMGWLGTKPSRRFAGSTQQPAQPLARKDAMTWEASDGLYLFGGQSWVSKDVYKLGTQLGCKLVNVNGRMVDPCEERDWAGFQGDLWFLPHPLTTEKSQETSTDVTSSTPWMHVIRPNARSAWPEARAGAAAWTVDNNGFFFGGAGAGVLGMNDCWVYDGSAFRLLGGSSSERKLASVSTSKDMATAYWPPDPEMHDIFVFPVQRDYYAGVDEMSRSNEGNTGGINVDGDPWPVGRAYATATAVSSVKRAVSYERQFYAPGQFRKPSLNCQGFLFGGLAGISRHSTIVEEGSAEWTESHPQMIVGRSVLLADLWRFDHCVLFANGTGAWTYVPGPTLGRGPRSFGSDLGYNTFAGSYVDRQAVDETGNGGPWPSGRAWHGAWSIGGQLYIFGGIGVSKERQKAGPAKIELSDIWRYSGEPVVTSTRRTGSGWQLLGGDPFGRNPRAFDAEQYGCGVLSAAVAQVALLQDPQPWLLGGGLLQPDCPSFRVTSGSEVPNSLLCRPGVPAPTLNTIADDDGLSFPSASTWGKNMAWPSPRHGALVWGSGRSVWIYGGATLAPGRFDAPDHERDGGVRPAGCPDSYSADDELDAATDSREGLMCDMWRIDFDEHDATSASARRATQEELTRLVRAAPGGRGGGDSASARMAPGGVDHAGKVQTRSLDRPVGQDPIPSWNANDLYPQLGAESSTSPPSAPVRAAMRLPVDLGVFCVGGNCPFAPVARAHMAHWDNHVSQQPVQPSYDPVQPGDTIFPRCADLPPPSPRARTRSRPRCASRTLSLSGGGRLPAPAS